MCAKVGQLSVSDLVTAVASTEVSPGAGAAGAVALALAAACAGKAVAITLKHRPEDDSLLHARIRLEDIAQRALLGADEDATRFEAFTHEQDAHTKERLEKTERSLQELAKTFLRELQHIEPQIDPVMSGDISAARALCVAFARIEARNLEETRKTRSE